MAIYKKGYWLSKDGGYKKMSDMDTSYLFNCKRLLERNCRNLEIEWRKKYNTEKKIDPSNHYPQYNDLIEELTRRGQLQPEKGKCGDIGDKEFIFSIDDIFELESDRQLKKKNPYNGVYIESGPYVVRPKNKKYNNKNYNPNSDFYDIFEMPF